MFERFSSDLSLLQAILSQAEDAKISPVSADDRISIAYMGFVLCITVVRKHTGVTESMKFRYTGKPGVPFEKFCPRKLSKRERNRYIYSLYDEGLSQSDIGKIMGLTQQTISNICKSRKPVYKIDAGHV